MFKYTVELPKYHIEQFQKLVKDTWFIDPTYNEAELQAKKAFVFLKSQDKLGMAKKEAVEPQKLPKDGINSTPAPVTDILGAGRGNRTPTKRLEISCSTIKPYPLGRGSPIRTGDLRVPNAAL